MKKILICLIVSVVAACSGLDWYGDKGETQGDIVISNNYRDKYSSDVERFRTNVRIVEKSPVHIIYEYKDVRIDELVVLARRYCIEQGQADVMFRETNLNRNFSRRAIFDCVILQ